MITNTDLILTKSQLKLSQQDAHRERQDKGGPKLQGEDHHDRPGRDRQRGTQTGHSHLAPTRTVASSS